MTKEEQCHKRLTKVFQETFDDASLQIKDEYNASNIPGWDSLAHINLIVEIEEEFGISFSTAEISGFSCVGDVKKLILKRAVLDR
jgi:acyl carrier protein